MSDTFDMEEQVWGEPLYELKWKTKDGRQLRITEMTNEHLQNSLKYLEKKGHKDGISWRALNNEWSRRTKDGILIGTTKPKRKEDTLIFDDE